MYLQKLNFAEPFTIIYENKYHTKRRKKWVKDYQREVKITRPGTMN